MFFNKLIRKVLLLFNFLKSFFIIEPKKFNSKCQIFMLDLIFSFTILIVAIGLSSIYFSQSTQNEDLFDLTQDILNQITMTSINSLNNEEIRDLFASGQLKNIDFSVAQQVSEFYYNGEFGLAQNITKIFIENYDRAEYNINITLIDGSTTENLYLSENIRTSLDNSKNAYSLKREVITFIDRTNLVGPYTFEVVMWQ